MTTPEHETIAEDSKVWLSQMGLPRDVEGLMVLSALGRAPEEAKTILRRKNNDGQMEEIIVKRIPLIDIGYPSEDAAHDAILRAMGY